ncbi:tripartite tricarboxylate transporter substrate binding protein [Achromobacter deleyi]|uniref:tripartite tricarboxylate transporter substrate binding protein n=1 Tax=Achromobacter deleyi TaxID=1353891 RepID=UPI0014909F49|nr:tripartite tricarboxylate transporter substrate binding protein [Achromobacter deleyi]QVQ27180.1 tripartite tricarboxylate transporter substrate binding protein [Achromobacter deleyi]UIP22769.1 tripartite tricarboxylate transporter substrate binding protein [Achromobacter deleyi]
MNLRCKGVAAAALLLLGAANSLAAGYPERPVTMVVPFPPGGVADTIARPLALAMGDKLGQPIVIENKGGAGGAIGIGQVGRAKPDGYTLLMSLSSISILPAADRLLERKPAYQLDQFVPIARITADPTVLVVRADAPYQTLQEFVAAAKNQTGKFSYGSSGIYGTMHVPMEMLQNAAGIKMMHVPFTGAGPAVQALVGGQVDAVATGPSSVMQLIQSGRVKALAHWGDGKLDSLPQVPSLRSQGYDISFVQWSGVFALAGTPQAVIDKLRQAVKEIASDPGVQSRIAGTGSPVQYLDAPAFDDYWKKDSASLEVAVNRIGKVE